MSRWADLGGSRRGRAAVAVLGAIATASAAVVLVTADRATATSGQGRALDIVAPVLDIVAPVSSLDDSIAQTDAGSARQFTLAADVLFAFDTSDLAAPAQSRLDEVAAALRSHAGATVTIDGYTDGIGAHDYNVALSVRRAEAVRGALAQQLGTSVAFRVQGHGEADPVASERSADGSDNPAARARNRRVTVTFQG